MGRTLLYCRFAAHDVRDERIAVSADRLISMSDGAFVDETMLVGGTRGNLAVLAGLGG